MSELDMPVKRTRKAVGPSESVQEYRMPVDVSNWIEQAQSRLKYLTNEVERLKEDNVRLKRENRMMSQRVQGMSSE